MDDTAATTELTTDLLIAGAGPTGLMAALVARRRGLRAIVVDPKPGPTRESRAIVLQARSMEILDQLDLTAPVLDGAQLAQRIRLRADRAPVGADFSAAQTGATPFPGARIFEQSRTEELLAGALAHEGEPVRYGHALSSFTADPSAQDGVDVLVTGPDGPYTVRARWLLGADGASSPVRHQLGLPFEGVTDEATFCVADLRGVEGAADDALTARLGQERFALLFPLGAGGHARMIWLHGSADPEQEAALAGAREDLGIRYARLDWFSAYRVHHRVAERFRAGPVLLAGDAAHVHSPVGGQGMNTGLQDAHHLVNLLADIASGLRAPEQLERYEAERRPVALTLVRVVDRAFGVIARPGRGPAFVRRRARDVLAVLVPRVLRTPLGSRLGGWLGQYRIHYHPLTAEGTAGQGAATGAVVPEGAAPGGAVPGSAVPGSAVPSGAVLPRWARDRAVGRRLLPTDANRAALREMGWQLHTYGTGDGTTRPRVPEAVQGPLAFPADPEGRLRSDLLYLVRPDGYVAAAWALHAGAASTAEVAEVLAAYGFCEGGAGEDGHPEDVGAPARPASSRQA